MVEKMAQNSRALVAAVLVVDELPGRFTQDVEDFAAAGIAADKSAIGRMKLAYSKQTEGIQTRRASGLPHNRPVPDAFLPVALRLSTRTARISLPRSWRRTKH